MSESTSLYFASQPLILLAAAFDEREVKYLSAQIKDIVEAFVPPRTTTTLQPEIFLLSRLVYYGMFHIFGNRPTPGESYCGLTKVQERESISQQPGHLSPISVKPFSFSELHRLYLLLVLLPYIHDRKEDIVNSMKKAVAEISSLYGAEHSASSDLTEGTVPSPSPSANESSLRTVRSFVNFSVQTLQDIHKCLFFLNGRFHLPSFRLASTRYVLAQAPTSHSQLPLQNVGILLAIRLGVMSASAVVAGVRYCLLGAGNTRRGEEIHSDERSQQDKSDVSLGNDSDSLAGDKVGTGGGGGQEDWAPRCALCREPRFRDAATTSCGHVFCYQCIVSCLESSAQCPICRQPQLPQQVRALYQYGT